MRVATALSRRPTRTQRTEGLRHFFAGSPRSPRSGCQAVQHWPQSVLHLLLVVAVAVAVALARCALVVNSLVVAAVSLSPLAVLLALVLLLVTVLAVLLAVV